MTYICKAYKGKPKPEACKLLLSPSTEKVNSVHPVCYVDDEARNLTSLTTAKKIPRLKKASGTSHW
jgi:hypothetical protein